MRKIYLILLLFWTIVISGEAQYRLELVKDINPGTGSSSPTEFTIYNNKIYFAANGGSSMGGLELWQSDGTSTGTVLVQDYNTGTGSSSPASFCVYNNYLYFAAIGASSLGYGKELCRYNEQDGISIFADVRPGKSGSSPSSLVVFDNKLYFKAIAASGKTFLFETDGTAAPVAPDTTYRMGPTLIPLNNQILVAATNLKETTGANDQLYGFDGKEFSLIKKIKEGSSIISTTFCKSETQNLVYFLARTDVEGYEPWVTDGTTDGTRMLKDINTVPSSGSVQTSSATGFTEYKGKMFFSADDGTRGAELWVSDGTADGTKLVKDIYEGTEGSNPQHFTILNDSLYFTATDAQAGNELYVTDGTPEKTHLVGDFVVGTDGSYISDMIAYNGNIYVAATISAGKELYKLVFTPIASNVIENKEQSSIGVYPNPSQGIFRVKAEGYDSYKIYDKTGKLLEKGKIQNSIINTHLESGNYILTILGKNTNQSTQININK